MMKERVSQGNRVRKTDTADNAGNETHDITLEVGSSILIDPAGEMLRIKEIKSGEIIFEQSPMKVAKSG